MDEAGRGPLAGPVVAAAVILPNIDLTYLGINDSKKISEAKREIIYNDIIKIAIDYGIGIVGVEDIEKNQYFASNSESIQISD